MGYLKYIHAATAIKTTARIQREESLIPVFLAMVSSYPGGLFPRKNQDHKKLPEEPN